MEMKKKEEEEKNLLWLIPELRSCEKVEVTVAGSRSLIVLMVSVDVKQH